MIFRNNRESYYIYTFNSSIYVVGTKFRVTANINLQRTTVYLEEGKIELWNLNKPTSRIILHLNEKAIILKKEKPILEKKKNDKKTFI